MAETKIPSRSEIVSSIGGIPSNFTSQSQSIAKEPIVPVVTGPVQKRKKGLGKRILSAFIGKDIQDVRGHIFDNVVIPTLKWTFCEMARSIPEFLFYGKAGPRTNSPFSSLYSGGYPYYNYSRVSITDQKPSSLYSTQTNTSALTPRNYMEEDIILASAEDAEALYKAMAERIRVYGTVSIAEVNEFLKQPTNPVEFDWGWRHLTGSQIRQVRGGFQLVLPQIIYLK